MQMLMYIASAVIAQTAKYNLLWGCCKKALHWGCCKKALHWGCCRNAYVVDRPAALQ